MTRAIPKSSNGARRIPEDIQAPIRQRLTLLREARNIAKSSVQSVAPTTILSYETRDISSLKMGDAIVIAAEYGMDPGEFFAYLFSGVTDQRARDTNMHADAVAVYMRNLPVWMRDALVDTVRAFVQHYERQQSTDQIQTIPRATSRARLRDAIAE